MAFIVCIQTIHATLSSRRAGLARALQTQPHVTKRSATKQLRVGFVPLVDCAPVVMARELGLFAKCGLDVTLSREIGWASVRDKIIFRELEASQAVAGMVVAATRGLGSIPCECVTGLVLNLHGNAITISNELSRRGVRTAAELRRAIEEDRGRRAYTFGVVFSYSSHMFLLRQWLKSGGIDPDRDVHLAVVPPPLMFTNLVAGHLDGFCVGEPWNAVTAQAGAGVRVATSRQLAPLHPEKVLMVRADFADERAEEHGRLIAALLEACAWCDEPANRRRLAEVLAQPRYVNAPVQAIRASLDDPDFHIFHRHGANEPSGDWIAGQMGVTGVAHLFRRGAYRQAVELTQGNQHYETTTV
jgi:ABC-type nitrate/sulfonate/bicarbonate transport system substrate-binding protein